MVEPGPRPRTLRILSLSLSTTLPHQPAKLPKKLSTDTSKLSFLTVTSITGGPRPFHNFSREYNLGFNFVFSKTIKKRIICLIGT